MYNQLKFYAAAAAMAMAANASAGVYVGYKMDASTKDDCGWTANRGEIKVANSIMTFEEGQNNSSSAYTYWGAQGFDAANAKDNGTDNYYVGFSFSVTPGNDTKNTDGKWDQQGYGIFIPTLDASSNVWTTNWWTGNNNYVFALTAVADQTVNPDPTNTPVFSICGSDNNITLTTGATYELEAKIDIVSHKVTYSIAQEGNALATGTYVVPDTVSILPTGVYVGANRYQGKFACSNLLVGKYVDGVVPNVPSYRLAEVVGALRRYSFSFTEGETLNYSCEAGVAVDLDENEVTEGTFSFDQIANSEAGLWGIQSGKISIWTSTPAGLTSDKVDIEVDATAVKLPKPDYKTVGVSVGFGKTFQVTIDNSDVITKPDIMFSYTINGDTVGTSLPSGTRIDVPEASVVKIFSVLYGFETSDPVTIVNNQYFEIKKDIDFAHMKLEGDLDKLGFVALDPLQSTSTSGETNWTGRGRMYDFIVTNDGADTAKIFLPGCTTEIADNIINRWEWQIEGAAAKLNEIDSLQAMMFAPLMFPNKDMSYGKANTIQIKEGIGLINNETAQNNVPYYFRGMGDEDYALVYKINGYGANSVHEYFATKEEALASHHGELLDVVKGNGSFELYRIDTSISRILILSENEEKRADVTVPEEKPENAIKFIKAPKIDNIVRDIMGREVRNIIKGKVYLKNGVKFVVK